MLPDNSFIVHVYSSTHATYQYHLHIRTVLCLHRGSCTFLLVVQVLRSILERPEGGASGTIEHQAAKAQALVMLAHVHKVRCQTTVLPD